jgi:hypothetical protein
LEWDYDNKTVDLSMPGYIKAALHKYQYPAPTRPKHAPHKWNPPVYGAKAHYVEDDNNSPAFSAKNFTKLQELTGTLLYYARAVDPTLIMPINLLNYCTTHPETKIRYHASDMILYIHSDASYLSEREAKSRAGGFFYMGSSADTANKLTNGEILIISTVLKHVMSSAAEAEIGAVFINAKEGTVLRTKLEEVGHPHPPTPLETDNTTATGYINGTIKQKRTRAIDMRFYSVKDKVKQSQFHVYWGPGY